MLDAHGRPVDTRNDDATLGIADAAHPHPLRTAPNITCSIIINSFNYGRFLRRCVESALDQTIEVEVIVVDDGSSDDSVDVLRSFGNDIGVIRQGNLGQGAAVNTGVTAASGQAILMLDSDDWMFPSRAERTIEALAIGHDWVRHALQLHDEDLGPGSDIHVTNGARTPEDDIDRTGATLGTMSGLAFTADLLREIGPIPPDIYRSYADGYLKCSAAYLGRCATLRDPLGVRHIHRSQASTTGISRAGVESRIRIRRHNALRAQSLSRHIDVARGKAWWQERAALHASCIDDGRLARLRQLGRYAASLERADEPTLKKAGLLVRESLLAVSPSFAFPRLWWLSSDGRPTLRA
jgi:glycosyltransferase involved in cell wall biosynthesis